MSFATEHSFQPQSRPVRLDRSACHQEQSQCHTCAYRYTPPAIRRYLHTRTNVFSSPQLLSPRHRHTHIHTHRERGGLRKQSETGMNENGSTGPVRHRSTTTASIRFLIPSSSARAPSSPIEFAIATIAHRRRRVPPAVSVRSALLGGGTRSPLFSSVHCRCNRSSLLFLIRASPSRRAPQSPI